MAGSVTDILPFCGGLIFVPAVLWRRRDLYTILMRMRIFFSFLYQIGLMMKIK